MARKKKTDSEGWRNRVVGTRQVNPETLTANPRNWRVHPKYQRQALASVLDEVGWVQQIIVNKTTGLIIDGHLRVALALERGEKKVPVDFVELDENEEAIVLATIDPIAAMAKTDDDLLNQLTSIIDTENEDLEKILGDLSTDQEDPPEDPEIPEGSREALAAEWGVKQGQLWRIGRHRLYCGDCSDPKAYTRLMGAEQAAVLFTDPPYGVSYKARSGRFEEIANDELTGDALIKFLISTLKHAVKYTRNDGAFYIWHASSTRMEFEYTLNNLGLEERQYLIWVKPAAVLGWGDYRWAHEPCFYACKDGETPMFYGDRTNTTTWYALNSPKIDEKDIVVGNGILISDGQGSTLYITGKPPKNKKARRVRLKTGEVAWLHKRDASDDIWEVGKEGRPEHPTEKPTELARRALHNSTMENEIVLDIFSGTGGTIIAAEQLDRRARCMELEPGYVAVALQRMYDMGIEPELEE